MTEGVVAVLTVVTGPPCAGKSTWVRDHATNADVIVDLDRIAHALGYPAEQIDWNLQHPARDAARIARVAVIDAALDGEWSSTWVIDSDPSRTTRSIYQRAGAEMVELDPGRDVCMARALARSAAAVEAVRRWYDDDPQAASGVGAWRL